MIRIRTDEEIALIRESGRLVAGALDLAATLVRPGVTTGELAARLEEFVSESGGTPEFKGYRGYPAAICASVNEEVVHGIPGRRKLREGDIVGIDVGVRKSGYVADGARTFAVGEIGSDARRLMEATADSLAAGLAAHNPIVHEWIRDHLEPDFQLCCYYDPSPRDESPHHVTSDEEVFDPAQRDVMARCIGTLKAPAVHYKVLAAGRTPVEEAFSYVARAIRPQDAVLVGFHLGDDPDQIAKTMAAFERIVPGGRASP